MDNKLQRPIEGRVVGGVCAAFGNRFHVDPIWFRLFFGMLLILPPAAILPYIVCWVIIPSE